MSVWVCVCRLFSLLEHERGCISFPSRNDGVFAHAAICVYIYICICCKVSFICTGLFKSALALFFSLARISLTHTRVHTHTHSPAIVSSWIQCSRSNYGKPTHRLCTSVMAGEEDKKNCGGMQVKAVCSAQTMTARTLIFILFYLLDKWKAKTQLWHASTSHDLCSPLEREK